ncbi:MAG: trigger factor [Candidatus Borkfalkiaceae bacterium]|nr:trigger factor [Christensenellaceae bacterium]
MEYKFEKGEKSTVKVTIALNATEWNDAQDKAYARTKGKYSLPGFRKGHVPKHLLEQTYGKGIFYEDAINDAFSQYYYDILEKEPTIEPVDRPDVSIDKIDDKGLTMTATVPVKPEVKIGAYKGIKIEKVEYNVKDEDVDGEVERLLKQHATDVSVTDRPARNGDETVIDYSGSVDGKKFDGGTAEKQNLTLGSGAFIPGFEEQVEGMSVGETKDINVKFPDDYGAAELKGKDAVFTVTLHEIREKKLPELTDEFVKEKTGSETVEAYKASVRERLTKNNEQRAERETEDKIVKAIADTTEVEIPDALVEKQVDSMVQDMSYRMMYQGLKMEDYLKYTNQTMESYREGFKEKAAEQVKTQLIIDRIITDEKLEATEEEIEAKIAEQAAAAKKEVEEYKKTVNDRQRSYIENGIVIDKLFRFLKENNEIA